MTDKDAYIERLETQLREAKDGERLLAAEVEGATMVCKCWRVGCIVGWVGFAWQFVWNVVKGMMQ